MLNAKLLREIYERNKILNYYGVTFPEFVFDLDTKAKLEPGKNNSIDSRVARLVEFYAKRQIELF